MPGLHSTSQEQVNGNYFMESACVRFLFTSDEVSEKERVSAANEKVCRYDSTSEALSMVLFVYFIGTLSAKCCLSYKNSILSNVSQDERRR